MGETYWPCSFEKEMIIWLTGQPGSGKTTIANNLLIRLNNHQKKIINIDGDNLRSILINKDYSREGRIKNIKVAQNIAQFLHEKNFIVIVSLVAPFLDVREDFKSRCNVNEVYLETTEIRGREHFFSKDYKKPINNFLYLDTGKNSVEECTDKVLSFCKLDE